MCDKFRIDLDVSRMQSKNLYQDGRGIGDLRHEFIDFV